MEKDFHDWHHLKQQVQDDARNPPTFAEREIWWCRVGMNLGHETDGKPPHYTRPVLVLRKFNRHIFLAVPLTTQIKDNPYYFQLSFKGRQQCAMLSQVRLWDSKRLTIKLGELPIDVFEETKKALKKLI